MSSAIQIGIFTLEQSPGSEVWHVSNALGKRFLSLGGCASEEHAKHYVENLNRAVEASGFFELVNACRREFESKRFERTGPVVHRNPEAEAVYDALRRCGAFNARLRRE